MIFQHTIEQILDGSKTQTRRVVKDGQYCSHNAQRGIYCVFEARDRLKYMLDKTYAVQPGRGKKGVARIRITGIRQERVQDITAEDAKAEGCEGNYAPTKGFFNLKEHPHICCYHGRDPVAHFEQLWDSIQPNGRRWDDNPLVWVIEFELCKGADDGS